MFNDKLSAKGIAIGFFGYLIASVIIYHYVLEWWWPPGMTDKIEVARLAQTDQSLLILESRLGLGLGLVAGFVTCHFSGARGLRNSLILGCLFALYGVLGIFLHPAHPTAMKIGGVLSPIPIVLCGGWLRLLLARRPRKNFGDV